jgi:Ca-activated chloride channel family protein
MKKLTTKITVTIIIIATVLAFCLVGGLVWGKTLRMAQANRDLTAGRAAAARKTYEDLAVDLPESPYVLHNLGLAAYQQGQYQPAVAYFQKALEKLKQVAGTAKQTGELTAKCHYHLGNAQFKLAEADQTGANSSGRPPTDLYRQALADFRSTLELNPNDQDAKYNYELTKLRLDDTQPQKRKDQDQPDKDHRQPKQQNKDKQPNQQNKADQQPKQPDQNKPDQKQSENRKSQGNDQKGQKQPANQKRGMTKQEAQALLDAAENGDQYMAPLIRDNSSVQKDW